MFYITIALFVLNLACVIANIAMRKWWLAFAHAIWAGCCVSQLHLMLRVQQSLEEHEQSFRELAKLHNDVWIQPWNKPPKRPMPPWSVQ